ncbi:MAG: alpha/beta fold hydrolase [Anaerolineae bacterium]|nr:alpha/beta fold hydrolase [Anaerolineae bacterium]MDW8299626.1 alpha/beta fold hydrolase [Anaerolineae bacterium]
MPVIDVNGQTIYYELLGSGVPAMILHGWMEVGRDHLGLAERLVAEGYSVILPDLAGYGRSVPPKRTYPADFYQRDAAVMGEFLAALLALLGRRDAHIFGFSDGGEVALLLGIERAHLCRSVTAWGAIGAFDQSACDHARRVSLPPTWVSPETVAKHPEQDVISWVQAWVEAFCEMVAQGGDLSLSRADQITAPLLLMLGERDALNPVAAGRRFVEKAAERRGVLRQFRVFPEVGHAIHEQAPEAFYSAIFDFLAKVDSR